jgi:hypothetical protein
VHSSPSKRSVRGAAPWPWWTPIHKEASPTGGISGRPTRHSLRPSKVNGATQRTTIAVEAVQALAQHGPVAPVIVHQRIDFAGSMVDGHTVGALQTPSRSANEITQLWKYV